MTGLAFELRDNQYNEPNRSLVSNAVGRTKEFKDRCVCKCACLVCILVFVVCMCACVRKGAHVDLDACFTNHASCAYICESRGCLLPVRTMWQ
jgi:hypothetical protein